MMSHPPCFRSLIQYSHATGTLFKSHLFPRPVTFPVDQFRTLSPCRTSFDSSYPQSDRLLSSFSAGRLPWSSTRSFIRTTKTLDVYRDILTSTLASATIVLEYSACINTVSSKRLYRLCLSVSVSCRGDSIETDVSDTALGDGWVLYGGTLYSVFITRL